jgi:hypothetical protein
MTLYEKVSLSFLAELLPTGDSADIARLVAAWGGPEAVRRAIVELGECGGSNRENGSPASSCGESASGLR